LAFATFLVWRLRNGACGVGACGFWRYRTPPIYFTTSELTSYIEQTFNIQGAARVLRYTGNGGAGVCLGVTLTNGGSGVRGNVTLDFLKLSYSTLINREKRIFIQQRETFFFSLNKCVQNAEKSRKDGVMEFNARRFFQKLPTHHKKKIKCESFP